MQRSLILFQNCLEKKEIRILTLVAASSVRLMPCISSTTRGTWVSLCLLPSSFLLTSQASNVTGGAGGGNSSQLPHNSLDHYVVLQNGETGPNPMLLWGPLCSPLPTFLLEEPARCGLHAPEAYIGVLG